MFWVHKNSAVQGWSKQEESAREKPNKTFFDSVFITNVHNDKPRCHTYAQDATNDYFNVAMNFSVNPLGSN